MNEINQFFSKLCLVNNNSNNPPNLLCLDSHKHLSNNRRSICSHKSKALLQLNSSQIFLVNKPLPLAILGDSHLYSEISSRLNKHNKFSSNPSVSNLSRRCLVDNRRNSSQQVGYSANNRPQLCRVDFKQEVVFLVKNRVAVCLANNRKDSNSWVVLDKEAFPKQVRPKDSKTLRLNSRL